MDITAWSAVSPYGLGTEPFAAGIRSRRPALAWTDPEGVPGTKIRLVPGFDVRQVLGKKGTRAMNRVTGLAVTAVGSLVASRPEPDAAIVLGTTTGSVQSMMDFTRSSLTGARPFDVEPAVIPSSVMNCAAGQCAIWHGITGPNTTIAGGRTAGLLGLAYARRLLLTGRARTVLCGAAEEYSPARSWLEHHSQDSPGQVLGEGAAMLRLERAGAPGALATVLGLYSQVSAGPQAPVLQATVLRALDRAGVAAAQVRAVVTATAQDRDALAGLFGEQARHWIPPVAELIGDTGAVSAVFQATAALTLMAEDTEDAAGQVVVLAATDPAGTSAAAVMRLAERRVA